MNGYGLAAKDLPAMAAPGLAIHAMLGALFLLALARPDRTF